MSAKQTPESFWRRVRVGEATACWEWQGACTSSGYGNVRWHGIPAQTHRVAYYLSVGGIELPTQFRYAGQAKKYRHFVLHKCDNRKCCNPAHLFLGSMRTNLLDAYSKGRKTQPRSQHKNAKLTPAAVRSIRSQYAMGSKTQVQLAAEFGVSQRAISLVVRAETYKDLL